MNMKKNIIYSVLTLLAALGFASCSSDSVTEPVASPDEVLTPIRISASYGGSDNMTRVAYTEDGNSITAKWEAGDELYVCYNGKKNTLTLSDGVGTTTATFTGTIEGTPSNNSVLICYVHDKNHPSDITFNETGEYYYADGTFTTQDGTLEGAAKRNVYFGATTYGTGENITCEFFVNTSMMKFMVTAPDEVNAGDAATLTYKSGDTELAKASFNVGENGKNTIYMSIPAGQHTGKQTLTYKSGDAEGVETLSDSKATFKAGSTYSKYLYYGHLDATPLTIEALTAGTVQVYMRSGLTMKYLKNSGTKTDITATTAITVNAGDKVYFYGNGTSTQMYGGYGGNVKILGSGDGFKCKVYGNIMSLLDEDNFANKTNLPTTAYLFNGLFEGNTTLTDASNLLLPVTTLAQYCYYKMFKGCTALTKAPTLPATTLAQSCYAHMFEGCTLLSSAPELPATTMTQYCYESMFKDCTTLTTPPTLPATTLASTCYSHMFDGCTALSSAPALPATTLAGVCYADMFKGCTSLTTPPALPATTLEGSCYYEMFKDCINLEKAPDLCATALKLYCYGNMFENCSKISSVKCLATSGFNQMAAVYEMLKGTAATGTFYYAEEAKSNWESEGIIPNGWTMKAVSQ